MPVNRMNKWGRLLRCVVGLLLEECYRDLTPPASGFPILFLLDEFVTCIGYMTIIEKAAAYAAGFGVKLWFIIQDISAFKAAYPKSYQSLLSNAGMIQVFGLSVDETAVFVSKMLGETEIIRNTISRTINDQYGTGTPSERDSARGVLGANKMFLSGLGASLFSSESASESLTVSEAINQQIQIVPLLRPDEIARYFSRESGAQLILIKGQLPVWALRVHYYDCPWFRNLFVEPRDPPPFLITTTAERP
jgi:type IV secretion system protein VirD4